MTLPAELQIADRLLLVKSKRSKAKAGGGAIDQDTNTIVCFWWPGKTTNWDMIDTLAHEAIEGWLLSRSRRYVNHEGSLLFVFDHADLAGIAGIVPAIIRAVMADNPEGVEWAAQYQESRTANGGKEAS